MARQPKRAVVVMPSTDDRANKWESAYESGGDTPVFHDGRWWLVTSVRERFDMNSGGHGYAFHLLETNPPTKK